MLASDIGLAVDSRILLREKLSEFWGICPHIWPHTGDLFHLAARDIAII